ncbi:hypothetical protein F4680DRAFT_419041 [Xylaria scruposa]|nr:hypothetical protein F4680DRAFT_419041 [Xylaria scruposa]
MEVPGMPKVEEEMCPTAHLPAGPHKRRLFKGTLKPASTQPTGKSYTLPPALISEVVIKDPAGGAATSTSRPLRQPTHLYNHPCLHTDPLSPGCPSTAISSTAVPQPFVDPAVLQRRPPPS